MRNFKQWSINDGEGGAIDKINAIGDAHRTDCKVTDYPYKHTSNMPLTIRLRFGHIHQFPNCGQTLELEVHFY